MSQICLKCSIRKDISLFEKQKNRPNHRKVCKTCRYSMRDREKEKKRHREYMKERRASNPDAVRINWERHKYGMAKEDFAYKCCWVCGSKDRLHIDHCHSSGNVRGLLCHGCNIALGCLADDADRIVRLKLYLETGPHFELDRRKYPA